MRVDWDFIALLAFLTIVITATVIGVTISSMSYYNRELEIKAQFRTDCLNSGKQLIDMNCIAAPNGK